ncbi:hypothetical protein BDW75DRAFT_249819 [Aspergillus navahoensis]
MVTIDDVASVIYRSVLNPWLTVLWPDYYLPLVKASLPMKNALGFLLACSCLRLHYFLTRRALNNGVSDQYDWSKEIAVVTGGAGGIGGEIVQGLSKRGTRVVVLDVLPLTYSEPQNVLYIKCDLTDEGSLHSAAEQIRAKWGHPTVLCAIAGVVRGKLLFGMVSAGTLTYGVNTIGLAMCYKEFVPAMAKANHGHVVTMSSQTAYSVVKGMVDYASSKSAALALHEGLQTELKHAYKAPKVRCTVVLPSVVSTKLFTGVAPPSQFFTPLLTPRGVADKVLDTVWAGEARHIELPWLMSLLGAFTRFAPSYFRVAVQDAAESSMDHFKGRHVMD